MFRPPIGIPRTLNINGAPLGATSRSTAAFVVWPPARFGSATDTFNVTARVEGDSSGMFRVVGMALADLVPDPDSRPGHRIFTWEIGPMIDGAGPVSVDVGEGILVTVEFACPSDPPEDTFTSVVVLDGLREKITIPVIAITNAKLTCAIDIDNQTTLGVGETKAFPFSISSTLGHDAEATLQYDSTFSPQFSSSEILVSVPKGGTANGFVTITNISAVSSTPHPYPVRFVVSETNGQHSSATIGLIIGASLQQNAPAVDIFLMIAAEELHAFWANNGGLITVGLPVGPVTRDENGGFHLPCEVGSLMIPPTSTGNPHSKHPRPLAGTAGPQQGSGYLIDSIEIVGCRCFATDDPIDKKDETYVVANASWVSYDVNTKQAVPNQMTIRTDIHNETKGDHGDNNDIPGDVIFTNLQLFTPIPVPGSTPVAFHIDLWDHENGDADKIRDQASAVAQDTIAVAAGIVTGLLAGLTAGVAAGVVSKISGLLSSVGDAIGDLVAAIFDDDRIDSKDFPIDSNYIQRLTATQFDNNGNAIRVGKDGTITVLGPPVQERTSDSLLDHTRTYNFPERVEDDSPEGRSWLFDAGPGGGTYRMFLRITASEVGPPFT